MATAQCRSDEEVTGGGFSWSDETLGSNSINPPLQTYVLEEEGGTGDFYHVNADNPGPDAIQIAAVAECAKLVDVP
jgi:hypothetical protein